VAYTLPGTSDPENDIVTISSTSYSWMTVSGSVVTLFPTIS